MRKLERMQLEGVAMADLDRVIGGVRIGSLSASDWMVSSAIGAPSMSSNHSLRGRHDGFVGILGFLPTHSFGGNGDGTGGGNGTGGNNLDLPPQDPQQDQGCGGCGCGGGMGDPSGGMGGMPPGGGMGGMPPGGGMGGMPPGGGGYGDPSQGGM